MQLVANEPSIGLYHVSQHCKRSVPKLVEMKKEYQARTQEVVCSSFPTCMLFDLIFGQNDVTFDMDFSISTAKTLQTLTTFGNIRDLLFKSMDIVDSLSGGYVACAPFEM